VSEYSNESRTNRKKWVTLSKGQEIFDRDVKQTDGLMATIGDRLRIPQQSDGLGE
jgi:hypothetical protein